TAPASLARFTRIVSSVPVLAVMDVSGVRVPLYGACSQNCYSGSGTDVNLVFSVGTTSAVGFHTNHTEKLEFRATYSISNVEINTNGSITATYAGEDLRVLNENHSIKFDSGLDLL